MKIIKKKLRKIKISPLLFLVVAGVFFIGMQIYDISGILLKNYYVNKYYVPLISPYPLANYPSAPTPKGTENWKEYKDLNLLYGIRYPPDMKISELWKSNSGVTFYRGKDENSVTYRLSVSKIGGEPEYSVYLKNKVNFFDIYNKPNGFLFEIKPFFNKERIEKTYSSQIGNYKVACLVENYPGSSQVPEQHARSCWINTSEGYFEVWDGGRTQNELNSHTDTIILTIKSFIVYKLLY